MNKTAICIYYDGDETRAKRINVSPQDTIDFSDEALRRAFNLHPVYDDILAIVIGDLVFDQDGKSILLVE